MLKAFEEIETKAKKETVESILELTEKVLESYPKSYVIARPLLAP